MVKRAAPKAIPGALPTKSHDKPFFFSSVEDRMRNRNLAPKCQVCHAKFEGAERAPRTVSDLKYWQCAKNHNTLLHPHK